MSIIYHIATASDWEQARRDGQYTTSTLGQTLAEQGFIQVLLRQRGLVLKFSFDSAGWS